MKLVHLQYSNLKTFSSGCQVKTVLQELEEEEEEEEEEAIQLVMWMKEMKWWWRLRLMTSKEDLDQTLL